MTEPTPSSPPTPAEPAEAVGAPDPVEAMRLRGKIPELAAVLAWLIPGLGHLYAGYPIKGAAALVLLFGMHVAGLVVSRGDCVSLDQEHGHPYAFVAQLGAGLPTGVALAYAHGKLPWQPPPLEVHDPEYVDRLPDVDAGLLFTMVAGLLNLLLIHDLLCGVPGAALRRAEEARLARRLEALKAELRREAAAGAPGPAETTAPAAGTPAPPSPTTPPGAPA